jgi:hypothetical protein
MILPEGDLVSTGICLLIPVSIFAVVIAGRAKIPARHRSIVIEYATVFALGESNLSAL